MTKFEFKSQICTSIEESKRLLALGLKKETADMEIEIFKGDNTISGYVSKGYWENEISDAIVELIPAWSLHRLIELCGSTAYDWISKGNNPYEDAINCLELLIKNDYYNKKYLEDKT